jgi:hypothetical protein
MYLICAGMFRSCSTWQYEVACHLIERHRQGERLGYITGDAFVPKAEAAQSESLWAVVKSHDRHGSFTELLTQGQALALYSYRDLRDVVYSIMHKLRASFEEIVERRGLLEEAVLNDEFWTTQPRILCQRYCDIIADPVCAVEQIAAHLDIRLQDGEAVCVAAAYSLEANLQRARALKETLERQGIDLADSRNSLINDPHTLVHWNHIRTGCPGVWRFLSNLSERIRLARGGGAWLIARGYEKDYNWVGSAEELLTELHYARQWLYSLQLQLKSAREKPQEVSLEPMPLERGAA